MSRRNILTKYQVWEDADSASITPSQETVVDQLDNVKYTIVIDSSVVCELIVEFTDDKIDRGAVWLPLDFETTLSLNGALDTDYTVIIEKHSCHKLRLNTQNNSGTGTINAWISGSNVGA